MKKKNTGKAGKIIKTIFKVLGIILAFIVLLILISTIRHAIKNRSDRKLYKDAYGQYFTTSSGDRINYTFMVLAPGDFDHYGTIKNDHF